MESVSGRLIAAAIGIVAVFVLTFASNSVEHAVSTQGAEAEQLTPDQLIRAYLAAAQAQGEEQARSEFFEASAVAHPVLVAGCDTEDSAPQLAFGADVILTHRLVDDGAGPVSVVEAFRVADGKVAEYWQSQGVAGPCGGDQP